jgi:hypothetical protein
MRLSDYDEKVNLSPQDVLICEDSQSVVGATRSLAWFNAMEVALAGAAEGSYVGVFLSLADLVASGASVGKWAVLLSVGVLFVVVCFDESVSPASWVAVSSVVLPAPPVVNP